MDPLLVDVKTAASLLSIGRSKFYQLLKSGEVKSIRIGTSRRVVVADLVAYVEAQQEKKR